MRFCGCSFVWNKEGEKNVPLGVVRLQCGWQYVGMYVSKKIKINHQAKADQFWLTLHYDALP